MCRDSEGSETFTDDGFGDVFTAAFTSYNLNSVVGERKLRSDLFSSRFCFDNPPKLIYMLMSLETDVFCDAQIPDFQDAHLKDRRGEK